MKTTSFIKFATLSATVAGILSACGTSTENSSQSLSVQDKLDLEHKVLVKCNNGPSVEELLTKELSKACREQNVRLKASGKASCSEDFCTNMVMLQADKRGLEIEVNYDGEVEFLVTISSDVTASTKEKPALICYAPVLKAQELLNGLGGKCR